MLDPLLKVLVGWSALAGVAALIALVINVLQHFPLGEDGKAQSWSAALNLIAMAVFLGLKIYNPQVDLAGIDAEIAKVAQMALIILGYVAQLGISKGTHAALRGVPVLGKSYSEPL